MKKVRVDLSTVYSNQTTNLSGLIIGECGCFSNDKDFKDYKVYRLIGISTFYANPYWASINDNYFKGFKYYIPLNKVKFEQNE